MAEQNNYYPVKGVIYEKKSEPVKRKKDPTQTYYKWFITLEVDSKREQSRGDKDVYAGDKNFIKFEIFSPKFDIESFMIGDFVEIRFFIEGKFYDITKGERAGQKGLTNRNTITFMKYADLDAGHKTHTGKIKVDSMSNADDLPTPKRETVFVAPDPDGEDFSDLPFIITALIGIGTLMPFML